jgi:hypothetical protein
LRLAVTAAAAAAVLPATAKPASAFGVTSRQLINGVLSGYGLPTLKDVEGLAPLLEQYDRLVVELQHPSDWIIARNVLASSMDSDTIPESTARLSFGASSKPMEGRGSGLTVGDYRKAEGLAFFVSSDVPVGSKVVDLPTSAIVNLVTPGDATSGVPECRVLKDSIDAASGYRKLLTKVRMSYTSSECLLRRDRGDLYRFVWTPYTSTLLSMHFSLVLIVVSSVSGLVRVYDCQRIHSGASRSHCGCGAA